MGSVQMMATMNNLMEEYLVRSLLLETTVQSTSTTGSVRLEFRLCNSCKFPLGGLRLVLQTLSHQSAAVPVDITSQLSNLTLSGEPFKLAAGGKLSGTVEYTHVALEPLQLITTLSFASPGTGNRLSSSHRQSIRLIDLCGHVLLHIGPREIGNAEQSGVHASFEAVQPRE